MRDIAKIKNHAQKLLELLDMPGEIVIAERDNATIVNLSLTEPSFLIGRHGETLEALQHVLRLLVFGEYTPEDPIVVVDINGYREKRKDDVQKMARNIAFKVRVSGTEEELPVMNAFDRRLIHIVVANIADVETESRGEGQGRRVVIKPKKTN